MANPNWGWRFRGNPLDLFDKRTVLGHWRYRRHGANKAGENKIVISIQYGEDDVPRAGDIHDPTPDHGFMRRYNKFSHEIFYDN